MTVQSKSDPALGEISERESESKREEIEREAFEKGFAQGERAGREMAERSAETALRSLGQAADLLCDATGERFEETVVEIVRLATAVARKVLQKEVSLDPAVVTRTVRAALSKGHVRGDIVIKVNPMDRDIITDLRPEILREMQEIRSLRVEGDEAVERGGAMIECAMGELDLRLERQLQEVEMAFERMLLEGETKG
ncbi:MAG: FliH/SctL family protein [Thermodesulfobacteriota bacterium]